MRRFTTLAVVLLLVSAACDRAGPAAISPGAATKPSTLLITLDTTRADSIGPGASDVATPAFNALAARGRTFRNAYATVPETLPSPVSMMTGLYPAGHGVHQNARQASHPVAAEKLKTAGYQTAAFVSAFVLAGRFGLSRGFDLYDDELPAGAAERSSVETTDRALAYLATATGPAQFVWAHYFDPHAPCDPPEPFRSQYPGKPYLAEVAAMDAQIGRLVTGFEAAVERTGGTSAIVIAADHGKGLGDHGEEHHGNLLYGSTMRVPLVVVGYSSSGCCTAHQTNPDALDALKTRPESTNFQETSRYQEVVDFMEGVAKAAPEKVLLTTFGETNEKRALPLAVIGAPAATPEAVRQTGKIRVYIQGNIHGGEVEGKESAQMLIREFAQGKHEDWLKTMVFLIAPIYNADGNERFALNNRGPQHGPMGGQGQRPNAQGLDLNRDHMKLDSPEARAVVKLMNDYDPHVSMDLHTTNGTRHAYHLTYAPPLNQATDPAIISLLRQEWLPWVTRTIRSKYNWDYYYYGNLGGGRGRAGEPPPERAWRSFDSRPRFNNNYIGLRNRIAVLSEAFAYASFKDRIVATSRFIEENLNFIHANAARVRKVVEAADGRQIIGTKLGLRSQLAKGPEVEILMGDTIQEKHPVDGHTMELRTDARKPERMAEYGTFEATETERVPSTYYVPADLTKAIDHLKAHGVRTTTLSAPTKVTVEEFQITGNSVAARAFETHTERTLTGQWVAAERELPAGTVVVNIKQPLGRLAFYLVEPRSDDGLVDWNIMDAALGEGVTVFPIVRSRH